MTYDPTAILAAKDKKGVQDHIKTAKEAWSMHKDLSRYKKRYDQVLALLDDEKRPGELFNLGLEAAKNIIESVVGSIEKHPYWLYHQIHFKVMKSVIDGLTSVKLAEKQFDSALESVEKAKQDSKAVLARYATSGELYKALIDSFNPVIVMAWLVRGTIEADIQAKKGHLSTLESWIGLCIEINKVHKAAAGPVNEMITHIACLRQEKSAVNFLVSSSEEKLAKTSKASVFGTFAAGHEEMSKGWKARDSGASEPAALVQVIDTCSADVEVVLSKWIGALDKFEADLYKMDVFAGQRAAV